jgi:dienelactone hydrolase
MRTASPSLSILILCAPLQAAEPLPAVGDEAFRVMARQFDYDESPLDALADRLRETEGGRVEKVVFTGHRQARVPAYLELPLLAEPPYPCVVLVHGLSRSKEYWWTYGNTTEGKHKNRLVAAGFAVLGLDLPLHGERLGENDFQNPWNLVEEERTARLRDLFVASVVDQRRALDYLATRADIDTGRVGLVGYELGATVAFCLAAVEPRLRAFVACVPPTVRDPLSVRATQNYAGHIGHSPFLLLMASQSRTSTEADAEGLQALFDSPAKELKVYHSDDRLPIWYVGDSVAWFTDHLSP